MFDPSHYNLSEQETSVASVVNNAVEKAFDGVTNSEDVASGIAAGTALWNHFQAVKRNGGSKRDAIESLAKIGLANLFDELSEKDPPAPAPALTP